MLVVANIASSRDEEATGGLVAHFFLIPSRLFSLFVDCFVVASHN